MTQNTHDFVEWANPIKTHQSGCAMGGNDGLGMKKFHSTFSNHLSGFS
jgi:hypothetical protein